MPWLVLGGPVTGRRQVGLSLSRVPTLSHSHVSQSHWIQGVFLKGISSRGQCCIKGAVLQHSVLWTWLLKNHKMENCTSALTREGICSQWSCCHTIPSQTQHLFCPNTMPMPLLSPSAVLLGTCFVIPTRLPLPVTACFTIPVLYKEVGSPSPGPPKKEPRFPYWLEAPFLGLEFFLYLL